jgi:lipoprotein signal peptidase
MSVPTICGSFLPIAASRPALAPSRSGQARRPVATATQSGQGEVPGREHRNKPRQWQVMLAVAAAVIGLDQTVKWWAWRHVAGVKINSGGDVLVGHAVGEWYAAPVTGALLDLLDFGLLSAALFILVRHRRPAPVLVFGALMLSGWSSNLLDRLGMHYWTAPGSVRGVVDFIRIDGAVYNVADMCIIGATPLFLLAVGFLGLKAADRPTVVRAAAVRHRLRASMLALAGAGLIVAAVAFGAANYGGVRTAPAHVSAQGAQPAPGFKRANFVDIIERSDWPE